jgi:hypothetical protein
MFRFVKDNNERAITKTGAARVDYFIMDKSAPQSNFSRWQQCGQTQTSTMYPNIYFHVLDTHKMPSCHCLHPADAFVTLQAQSAVLTHLQSLNTYHMFVRQLLQAQEFDAQFARVQNRDHRRALHAWLQEATAANEAKVFTDKGAFMQVMRDFYLQLIMIDVAARMLRHVAESLVIVWWPPLWNEDALRKELIERFGLKEK